MPNDNILALLIEERDKLNRAIEALEGSRARRGRPPKAATASIAKADGIRRRGHMSPAARKAQSARMREYWANRRKEAAKKAK